MSTATKDYPSGGLRVSDADRDRAIAELSGHPGLIALVPVLVVLIVRRLAGGRGARHPGDRTP